jgi:hypothetical protein
MEFRSNSTIGKMAVVTDAENDKSEVVKVDALRMLGMTVNHDKKSLAFGFMWGGYDSTGKWNACPALGASNRTINSNVKCNKCTANPATTEHEPNCEAAIYQACCIDAQANPILDHGEAFVSKVLIDHGKLKDIVESTWALPVGMTLSHNGTVVYTKEAPPEKVVKSAPIPPALKLVNAPPIQSHQ